MSAEELIILSDGVAMELAKNKTYEEILMLRSLLSQISQTLLTLASGRRYLEKFDCKDKS